MNDLDSQPRARDAAYLALGSNLGDRWQYLADAINEIGDLDREFRVSPIYESAPSGGPDGQGRYLNCVVGVRTSCSPRELLEFCQHLEQSAKRVRTERFGPRTLDVDVLLIEGFASDDPELIVPHPRMNERAFVLAPLEDLDSNLVDSSWRERLGKDAEFPLLHKVGELIRSPRS